MLWLILIPVILIALIFALDALITLFYRYDRRPPAVTPAKYDIPFDEIRIPVGGDASLASWWIPSKQADAPALILIHGWGRNRARMLPHIRELHARGYNLLALDARNHGASSNLPHPNVGTFAEDILAAVDFLARDGRASGRIGVLGLSIGGGAAVNAAGWDHRIGCAITVGAISHPVAVMRYGFQKKHVPDFIALFLLWYMQVRYRLDFERIAPVNNIRKADADFLIIHGSEDQTVPLEQGRALAAAAGERGELWVVPGKAHSNCCSHPEFWTRVGAFLERTLPPA